MHTPMKKRHLEGVRPHGRDFQRVKSSSLRAPTAVPTFFKDDSPLDWAPKKRKVKRCVPRLDTLNRTHVLTGVTKTECQTRAHARAAGTRTSTTNDVHSDSDTMAAAKLRLRFGDSSQHNPSHVDLNAACILTCCLEKCIVSIDISLQTVAATRTDASATLTRPC